MANNTVTVIGNLTRDPELRFTNSGLAVANFTIAWSKRKKTDAGWEDGPTSFFDCVAFGELGENIAESAGKGNRVFATGELQQRSWETSEGDKRSKVELLVEDAGPSLRWATATVARTERREPAQTTTPAGDKAADAYNEEPF